ncbi:MAG: GIY-YIG nuclease family protein [Mariniblastus sp.]
MHRFGLFLRANFAIASFIFLVAGTSVFGQQDSETSSSQSVDSIDLNTVVIESFKATHDGYSSDEVILNKELNDAFISECQKKIPNVEATECNWKLMNLRKAGKLKIKSTKSNRTKVDDVRHIAEIAARSMFDRYSISSDEVMANPDRRNEFDAIAKSIDSEIDLYRVRKAAFQLRKARNLKPELITRIADWGREVKTYTARSLASKPEQIPNHPGVYIFRDKTGYLYIGQTDNLHERLKTHLDKSHNQSLAAYLGAEDFDSISIEVHSFDPKSQAKKTMVRRAYESELIASRKPRFNIQP